MASRRIAILGAGNGGVAMAADLTLAGHRVSLYQLPEFKEQFQSILSTRRITLEGVDRKGTAEIYRATTEIAEALEEDVEVIFVVTPAFGHETMARLAVPHLRGGQLVVLTPGGFGSWVFFRALKEHGLDREVTLAETATLPYGARLSGEAEVIVHIRTVELPVAALPASRTGEVLELLREFYPEAVPAQDVLDVALNNTNPCVHPPSTLLNAGRIEYASDFYLYVEGMTPSVRRVMRAVDQERVRIREVLGYGPPHYEMPPDSEALLTYYGPGALAAGQKMRGPLSLTDRYITEDVPYGLVFYESVAQKAGVATPVCSALIDLAGVINGADYRKEGRSLANLGLGEVDLKELQKLLRNGE